MASVTFIGLGMMGAPMARNILRKGHVLTVFDVHSPAIDAFAETNARRAASPAAAITSPEGDGRSFLARLQGLACRPSMSAIPAGQRERRSGNENDPGAHPAHCGDASRA